MNPNLHTYLSCLKTTGKIYTAFIITISLFAGGRMHAQQSVVLPGNGSYIQKYTPQGAIRSQRAFYLITPREVQAGGLTNGMPVSSIGFTIGAAQDSTTKGSFKVYLQNTTDTVSRTDTAWTTVNVPSGTSYNLSSLVGGTYEWQVRTNCATPSAFSPVVGFSIDNLGSCNPPTNLTTTNITAISATFSWVAPASTVIKYYVEYKHQDSTNWVRDSTTQLSYTASGLKPSKYYQWQIKTVCSGDTSRIAGESFITSNAVSAACGTPGSLTNGTITNTSAAVSWSAITGASYYSVQYRRKGTTQYLGTTAFSTTFTINGLSAGTTYEWQVRAVCTDSTGVFASGTDFTTTGATACYAPISLSTNSITESSATLTWSAVTGAPSYEVRYRLKEAISWTNATTSMILVHNDSLTIPNTAGIYTISFAGGGAFTYTGGGVYVAWEYSNSTGRVSSANTTIGTTAGTTLKGAAGQDSAKLVLSLAGISKNNSSVLPTTLTSISQRPETRLGSSSLRDSVEVSAVYALGNVAPNYSADSITALIKNKSGSVQTYTVTLTVKEQKTSAVRYTNTQSIAVGANTSKTLTFTGWSPTQIETDSLIVSIPVQTNENVVNNNSNYYLQNVTTSNVAYDDGSRAITQAGNDTLPILLLNRYHMNVCGKINGVKVYLSASAKGHEIYAVALNAAHTVIAQSSSFTPDSTQVNNYHTFYFPTQPFLKDVDYYVGLAQPTASNPGYFPVGVQWEGASPRSNAYFRAKLNGDSLTNQPLPGRLMIAAELISGGATPVITGNFALCPSTTQTLTAGSANIRFADSVIGFSSQNSNVLYSVRKALGTTDVFPSYGLNANAWISGAADGSREYLVLRFPNAAPVNFIDIYETLNPGAVDTVFVKNPATSNFEAVYTRTASAAPNSARRNRISFPLTPYSVSEVRIALNSPAVPGFNAIDAVGIGQMNTTTTFSSYLWSPGGETTQTKTVSSAGVYKVTVTDASGCSSSDSVTVIASSQVTPAITATRPTTFCQGDSTILKSSLKGGNTWSTGATTDSIMVKVAGSYTVTHNDGTGCGTKTSAATVVTVNSLPTPDITGNTPFCSGGSITLNAGTGYSNYQWSTGAVTQTINVSAQGNYWVKVTNGNGCKAADTVTTSTAPPLAPTITGNLTFCPGGSTTLDAGAGYASYTWSTGANTRTITVNTAGTFSVSVSDASGCSGTSSVTTSLYSRPTPTITGNLTFCPGGSTTLDAGAGFNTYSWSTGTATQTISVAAAGTYSVTVTNGNGCSGTASVTTSLYTAPSPTISGNIGFCSNSSTTLTANTGYNSYSWSTNATTPSINVNTAGTYTVTVTDNNSCSGSRSVTVSQYTPPSPTISGTLSFCGGSSTTLDAGAGYSTYSWNTGATTRMITVTSVGTFTVTVTDNNGCMGSASATTTQDGTVPASPGPINGPTGGLCNTTGNVYSISAVPNTTHYVWTVPNGATITNGQGTTSITASFGPSFTSGDIVVAASNACGQSSSLNPRTLMVQAKPAAPSAITGHTTGLCNKTGVGYSINPVAGATSYTWSVPTGAIITSGQGTTSISVSFGNTFSSGNICVTANGSCGSSSSTCRALGSTPSLSSGIAGPSAVCSKQTGVVYSVAAAFGAVSYNWTVPSQATITSGQGTNSITVKFGSKGGNVSVKANNACGSSNTQIFAVTMHNCATTTTSDYSKGRILQEEITVAPDLSAKVLPNPATGYFTVVTTSNYNKPLDIRITDALGRTVEVKSKIAAKGVFRVGYSYKPGTYYAEVVQGKEKVILKLVKLP